MDSASEVTGAASHAGSVLRHGEMEFRRLLEKLPAGAYTCDERGLITYYNRHAVQLWGRAPKLNDPIDRFCGSFKLFAPDGAPIAHDRCWMALALQMDHEYNGHEIVIERPDGHRITALAHANPIRDESGKLLGAVNVLVDISDRKHAEDALKEADRAKNEFLATLAHELRNPLAPISNAAELLRRQVPPGQDSEEILEVIDRQLRHMTRLIDDLLDVARITGNKLELRKERVALADVVRAAVEASRPLLEKAGHKLAVTVPTDSIELDGDPTRLAQVISNLLDNARKYTEAGGHVWLIVERQGSDAVITVRDTGIGIAAEMLPRIFDMFTQADRSLERSRGGLGLGLTLVKRLVTMHGGSIVARSDGPGKGSEFIFRLPVIVDASPPMPRPSLDRGRSAAVSSLRILIVDDNRDAVSSMAMLLRLVGNDIRTAHDGLEAVGVAAEFRPNVVLLDIGLPKMNGYDAARHIRQQPWGTAMVLIAMTGWGQEADKERSREAGFDQHLVKPVDPAALIQLLASLERSGRSLQS